MAFCCAEVCASNAATLLDMVCGMSVLWSMLETSEHSACLVVLRELLIIDEDLGEGGGEAARGDRERWGIAGFVVVDQLF